MSKDRLMSEPVTPTCGVCGRGRTIADAYDYHPFQVVTGQPLGWYSSDDGEFCPECMTEFVAKANRGRHGES